MAVIGTSFDFTARYFAERLGRPLERGPGARRGDGRRSCTSACGSEVEARPGAVELVERLRGPMVPLGLASNSPRFLVDDALRDRRPDRCVRGDRHLRRRRARQAGAGHLPAGVRAARRRRQPRPWRSRTPPSGVSRRQGGGPDLHRACRSSPRPMSPPRIGSSTRSRSSSSADSRGSGSGGLSFGHVPKHQDPAHGPMPASDDEISAAALQYVRKVSGYRKPSTANEHAFDEAVAEVAAASKQLLEAVASTHPHAHARPEPPMAFRRLGDRRRRAMVVDVHPARRARDRVRRARLHRAGVGYRDPRRAVRRLGADRRRDERVDRDPDPAGVDRSWWLEILEGIVGIAGRRRSRWSCPASPPRSW